MKTYLLILACCAALTPQLAAADPDSDSEVSEAKKLYLVEMSCSPADLDAVGTTLRTALALREDKSEVALFIELNAVPLAKPSSIAQPPELRQETDRLFEKMRSAGIHVLVCPHCAEQQQLPAKAMRQGVRFTSKAELDAMRRAAEKIYEYRRENAADPVEAPGAAKPRPI